MELLVALGKTLEPPTEAVGVVEAPYAPDEVQARVGERPADALSASCPQVEDAVKLAAGLASNLSHLEPQHGLGPYRPLL